MGLKLLVVGSGGREHALAKKFIESPLVDVVYCAPGNAGMKKDGIQLVPILESNHDALLSFSKSEELDWVFVGPEVPLLNGLVDDFEAAGIKAYGPTKKAALIEGSKDFAKELMSKYHIPTASYQTFDDYLEAVAYVQEKGAPIVIKADGLAAGKGVVVAETVEQAITALKEMLEENKFGKSGAKVVIEEFLEGEEFSLLAFVRGQEVFPMVIAQDHKRVGEGDQGLNTGGMGAYSPVPHISETVVEAAIEQVLKPAAKGMIAEGRRFDGILYAGLIATSDGPKVIEFNARFGDPETQVVLQRLESDLVAVIDDLLHDRKPVISWKETGFNIGVVVAAQGYPEEYENNIVLDDVVDSNDVQTYFAGVKELNGQLVSNGGRIYLVEAEGKTLKEAQTKVYNELAKIKSKETFYRSDIGFKGIK